MYRGGGCGVQAMDLREVFSTKIFVLRPGGYVGVEVVNVCPDAETGMFGAFEELKEGCGRSRQT